jgi:UDP-N-acetylglucosamine acyltransferase
MIDEINRNNIIHASAVIENGAVIGVNNYIGPYSVIGKDVVLGDNNHLKSHVVIDGFTTIGNNNKFFPFATIGLETQDKKFTNGKTYTKIGNNNVFREYCSVNSGTEEGAVTTISNDCLLMISSHVAHDCFLENNVRLTNNASIAGHVHIGEGAIVGGMSGVHQHARIGKYSMIGGLTAVIQDVPPYGLVVGERGALAGVNLIGLKKNRLPKEQIEAVRNSYKILFEDESDKLLEQKIAEVRVKYADLAIVSDLLDFLTKDTTRNICQPKKKR